MRIASANMIYTLPDEQATRSLDQVLAYQPDAIGLQEWFTRRAHLLPTEHYEWYTPRIAGCPIGYLRDRYELLDSYPVWLSWYGKPDPGARDIKRLRPRIAAVVVLRERVWGRRYSILNYHLDPAVQAHGLYREDRPILVRRHRNEARRLRLAVARALDQGNEVYAMGDSNFHGFSIPSLVSAWQGREDSPGTWGHRRIDDVFGPEPATAVTYVETDSDHLAIVVDR